MNIATFGTGKAATIAKDAAKVADLKDKFKQLKDLSDKSGKVQDLIAKAQGKFPAVEAGKSVKDVLATKSEDLLPEDIVRVSAQIAGLADPTGVADVVGAYAYSKCSKIKA